jgi:hypothetical protein
MNKEPSRKEQLLKELVEVYNKEPGTTIVDVYYRLSMILHDLKMIIENKGKKTSGAIRSNKV